jgi:hypothetical protein
MKLVSHFLQDKKSPLAKIIAKAQELQYLNKIFAATLEGDLAKHCFITNLIDTQIHITADSSAWATKLRYATPEILKSINTQPEFKNIKKIKYSIGSFK